MRFETREEERGVIGPGRARTPETAHLTAKMLKRDKRALMGGKGLNTREASPTSRGNTQVRQQEEFEAFLSFNVPCFFLLFLLQLFFCPPFQRTFCPIAGHSSPQSTAPGTQALPAPCPRGGQGVGEEEKEAAGTLQTWALTPQGPSNKEMKSFR